MELSKNKTNKYDDIINFPHHISKKHPQMSIEARSAQFAPFAALTGYEDLLKEISRMTDEEVEINEDQKEILDTKIQILKEYIDTKPLVCVVYFIKDNLKSGGKYETLIENVIKINEYSQSMIFESGKEIYLKNIVDLSGDFLNIL